MDYRSADSEILWGVESRGSRLSDWAAFRKWRRTYLLRLWRQRDTHCASRQNCLRERHVREGRKARKLTERGVLPENDTADCTPVDPEEVAYQETIRDRQSEERRRENRERVSKLREARMLLMKYADWNYYINSGLSWSEINHIDEIERAFIKDDSWCEERLPEEEPEQPDEVLHALEFNLPLVGKGLLRARHGIRGHRRMRRYSPEKTYIERKRRRARKYREAVQGL